jgi:hypothetical protein
MDRDWTLQTHCQRRIVLMIAMIYSPWNTNKLYFDKQYNSKKREYNSNDKYNSILVVLQKKKGPY